MEGVLLVLIQHKSSEGPPASQRRPDLEPSPLPKLGLIHERYSVTLLVCVYYSTGKWQFDRPSCSKITCQTSDRCSPRHPCSISLDIRRPECAAVRVEKVPQINPERALCARVSISRGSVEENSCPEEQEASWTFSDRAVAPAWLVAFGGRPRLGLTVPLREMYFQSYRVCN
jgi:hypothetical protein